MDMTNEVTAAAHGAREIRLLEVHMKEVAEKSHASGVKGAQPAARIGLSIEQI